MAECRRSLAPAGAGKSTLTENAAQRLGWHCLAEDHYYWVENGWAHGTRTVKQEAQVQQQVFAELKQLSDCGKHVVLEFILYKNPPNPLTGYEQLHNANHIEWTVLALKPTVTRSGGLGHQG